MHLLAPPWPALDDPGARITLRDGSVASLRAATAADRQELARFFHELGPESRRRRFFAAGDVPPSVVEHLSSFDSSAQGLTLIAERLVDGDRRAIAAGSYVRSGPDVAEVAFAVADEFQGKGIATALLERLAVEAETQGIRRFEAYTLDENAEMLDVFRDSGFQVGASASNGSTDVHLSLARSTRGARAEEERRRVATIASIRPLLEPHSVAVVGASRDVCSIGRRVLDAIVAAGFRGPVYPVNPHAAEVGGLKAFGSTRDLPPGVDLAIVAVPAAAVESAVHDCAMAGVRALVIVSAGFAEAGPEGRALQNRLVDVVRLHGMRMVGPNCMGVINAADSVRLNGSFSPIMPPGGQIGLLSQSGALGLAIIRLASERQLGLSTFVSIGNKADVSGNDLLEYWESDPRTRVILLYLESFGNPRRFARLARRVGRTKPIVAIKSGRSRSGSRAATSHTAAMAASDRVVDALFRQTGVIRADTLDEMFDVGACLELQPLPGGRRVAVVTNAGGPGILAADACEAAGLALPELSTDTRAALAACLPPMASSVNPVDLIASAGPDEYRRAIEAVLSASEIDALIVIYTPVDATSAPAILDGIRRGVSSARNAGYTRKPVLTCVMAEGGNPVPIRVSEASEELLPAYAFPENAARALAKAAAYAEWRTREAGALCEFDDIRVDEARDICRAALRSADSAWLETKDVLRLLSAFGLAALDGRIVNSADEAAAAARALGFPVAAKLSSVRIQHKSDIGGVRLGLADEEAVRNAFEEITARARQVDPGETAPAHSADGAKGTRNDDGHHARSGVWPARRVRPWRCRRRSARRRPVPDRAAHRP